MKRLLLVVALMTCLVVTSGCGTAIKRGLGEVITHSARSREIEGGSAAWTTYDTFEFGRISDAMVGGQVPEDLMAQLTTVAGQKLTEARLFRSVGPSGGGKALLMTGEVVDFDDGSIARAIGSDKPFLTVRATFKDKSSGRSLAVVNLQSTVNSLRDWKHIVAEGLGGAVEKYLKSKGMQKLPE